MLPDPTDHHGPSFPEDAPFSTEQRAWVSGYMAGLRAQLATLAEQPSAADATNDAPVVHILYGSQTGNAEGVAESAAELAAARGLRAPLHELDATSMEELAAMQRCIVVVSTYGEGEMPDNAELFWEALSSSAAPRLESLRFAVLGLGDTSYDQFCQSAKLIDTRLEQLGAQRLVPRIDCDIDYETPAEAWLAQALPLAADGLEPVPAVDTLITVSSAPTTSAWTRKRPYASQLTENTQLSGSGSAKDIRHIAFALADSGIEYTAGDALGVMPVNHETLIEALLERMGAAADEPIAGHDEALGELLRTRFEIMTPSKDLLEYLHQHAGDDELSHVVGNGDTEAIAAFLWGKDLLDLLALNPSLPLPPSVLIDLLRPLQHRAYSISSSALAHPDAVHLTVAAVRWRYEQREHRGVASTWLADALTAGDRGGIFVLPNKNFRLPVERDRPIIMVGPGTGIAPFRAFLQERQALGANGKSWLFFGDQHRADDFIYEQELTTWAANGTLTQLDLAFSRDQSDKVYVQHRMLEQGAQLFAWLQDGAHFYVCGDATRMARDVDTALHAIVRQHGAMNDERAAEYVAQLKRNKRYLRDVY
ncbi:MAG: flavodoxin domain-containing protein [Pseudomonadota bacterium]